MKKLIIIAAILTAAVACQAASVTWKYTGTSSEVGYSVYLFANEVAAKYETFAALTAASLDSATVQSKKVGPKTSYVTPETTTAGSSITKGSSLYFVIIENSSATTYKYGMVDAASYIYDPDNQESSPGALNFASAALASPGTIGSVPEPTSGILLMLGVAALALRRKQA